jgi:ABC-type phosphate transport system substrate-binding protein
MTLPKRSSSVVFVLALLLSVMGVPKASANRLHLATIPVVAQAPAFPLPSSVPTGTALKIEGSTSMTIANQALKQQFESQYQGTTVDVNYTGADESIQSLLAGRADVAAIGRPLTDAEKAQGLNAVPVSRNKIAILVGEGNAFQGSLTTRQFAQIFRGEITDWSQVGGTPGAIRVIDRPVSSDTRAAFARYPVFQDKPFESASSAVKLTEDTTEAVVKDLGNDGIGYAIANQADFPGARIVPMHKVLPDDERYPFSQPLSYVYQGATPRAAIANFLGFATAPVGQTAITTAQAAAIAAGGAAVAAVPSPAASPSVAPGSPSTSPNAVVATTEPPAAVASLPPDSDTEPPGWLGWLLLVPLLGLLLGWWLKRRGGTTTQAPYPLPTEAASVEPPPNATEGGGLAERAGSVISADRVSINGGNPPAGTVPPTTIPPTTIPPTTIPPTEGGFDTGAAIGAAAAGAAAIAGWSAIPRPEEPVEANPWDEATAAEVPVIESPVTQPPAPPAVETPVVEAIVPPVEPPALAEPPAIIEEPVAEVPTPVVEEPAREASAPDLGLAGAAGMAGAAIAGAFISAQNRPATTDDAQSAVEAAKFDVGQTDLSPEELASVDEGLPDLPEGYGESQIVLIPRDPHWAYAYWDVPQAHREEVRRQGGMRLALRLYDVTDVGLNVPNSHSVQQFDCEEFARDWYLPVPVSDRDYCAEIGYLTAEGNWLLLARSLPIRIPPVYPSDWVDDQEVTVEWDEDLKDKVFLELVPPSGKRAFQTIPSAYFVAQAAEAQRVAGSIEGSVQPIASVSSFTTQSGVGMSGIGMSGVGMSGVGMSGIGMLGMVGGVSSFNMSGVGMSGIGMYPGMNMSGVGMSGIGMYAGMNMSGIGMSGIGMYSGYTMSGVGMNMSGIGMSGIGMNMSGVGFASAPPIRPRQFWLVADAELIVYGATEPDATLTIGGQPIQLNPDGTFRIQLSFQDGVLDFPIMAVAIDGEQNRSVHLNFKRETPSRNTNTKEEAQDEWGDWGI